MKSIRAQRSQQKDIKQVRQFVIQLGNAMHEYGTPSHRLELLKKGSTIFLTRDPRDMVISQFYYLSRVNNKYNSRRI